MLTVAVVGPAIDNYSKTLQLKESDNAARQIYMAAQHRAQLLNMNGELESIVADMPDMYSLYSDLPASSIKLPPSVSGTNKYVTSTMLQSSNPADDVFKSLLPSTAIDPYCWKGFFLIAYDEQGQVVDVIFSRKAPDPGRVKYDYGWLNLEKEYLDITFPPVILHGRSTTFVGYYGSRINGVFPVSFDSSVEALPAPILSANNGQTYVVTAQVWSPTGLADTIQMVPTLEINGQEIKGNDALQNAGVVVSAPYKTALPTDAQYPLTAHMWTYTYDLTNVKNPGNGNFNFLTSVSGYVSPGVITKEALYFMGTSSSMSGNCLYANYTVTDNTHAVSLTTLRHLKNLSALKDAVTGSENQVAVKQLADIDCAEYSSSGTPVPFEPLTVPLLASYEGSNYTLRNLYIMKYDSDKVKNVGLFASISKTVAFKNLKVEYPRVTNTYDNAQVGVLAGNVDRGVTCENVRIERAQVMASGQSVRAGGFFGATGTLFNDGRSGGKASYTACSFINGSVRALDKYGSVGGFVGYNNCVATITQSRVCWEPQPEFTTGGTASERVKNAYSNMYYQLFRSIHGTNAARIIGTKAGGFVGYSRQDARFDNKCYAATSVSYPVFDDTYPGMCGSFVGQGEHGTQIDLANSWGNCLMWIRGQVTSMSDVSMASQVTMMNMGPSNILSDGKTMSYGSWWQPSALNTDFSFTVQPPNLTVQLPLSSVTTYTFSLVFNSPVSESCSFLAVSDKDGINVSTKWDVGSTPTCTIEVPQDAAAGTYTVTVICSYNNKEVSYATIPVVINAPATAAQVTEAP